MAVIDFVNWESTPDLYAYKFPENNLSTLTQLVVHESQEAVLFSKGEMIKSFGAGKHTLSTENIPILRKLFGLPFGGKNPFTAEVWFVNKAIALDVKWGTPTPLQLLEPNYKIMVPVRAFGQFGIQIVDSEKFLLKLVGTMPKFDRDTMQKYFKGILLKHASAVIGKMISVEKVGILEMVAHTVAVSDFMKEALNPEFNEFGVNIVNFDVSSLNVPEDDPSVKKLKEVLARKMEMDALGYDYQQQRSFDVMEKAAGNEGSAGSIMGAGVGMGMGVNMGNMMGGMMGGMVNQAVQPGMAPQVAQKQQEQAVLCTKCGAEISMAAKFCGGCGTQTDFSTAVDSAQQLVDCDKCSKTFPATAKFCPECGDPYNPCGACAADNPDGATSCRKCNAALPAPCPKCNTKVSAGAKFCPNCGLSMVPACIKCKAELPAGAKFCGECGSGQG